MKLERIYSLEPGGWLDTDEQIIYTAGAGKAVYTVYLHATLPRAAVRRLTRSGLETRWAKSRRPPSSRQKNCARG